MSLRHLTLWALALLVIVAVLVLAPVQSSAQYTVYTDQPDLRIAMRVVELPTKLATPECPIPGSAGGGC